MVKNCLGQMAVKAVTLVEVTLGLYWAIVFEIHTSCNAFEG
jgi:hypothetical protein